MLTLTLRGLERDGLDHANGVSRDPTPRRLRADAARQDAAGADLRARGLGRAVPDLDPGGAREV